MSNLSATPLSFMTLHNMASDMPLRSVIWNKMSLGGHSEKAAYTLKLRVKPPKAANGFFLDGRSGFSCQMGGQWLRP